MSLSPELRRLQQSLSCCTYNGAQHSAVIITESDPSAVLRNALIQTGSGDWFSFSPDQGRGPTALMSPLLTCGDPHKHHRACDCVIIMRNAENQLTVVYIDLKSGNPKGYEGQFKSTRQFVRYAVELLKEFHASPLEIAREQYVILYGGRERTAVRKTTTTPNAHKSVRTSPGDAFKKEIPNGASVYFKEILGRVNA
ncbi:hypothetical protein [Alcaligenes sp. SMD-FA]|uniref:hypothetical protein n=1 Tax=Alcaligenes sp. SMD-FA TaxID=2991054 RepID=UPI0022280A17|nr:hypothetical protein [Alcaligenes sp. SMD-FA]UYY88953.1 hypothetical protein OKX01_08760 [Alcaligenes sp. SMD-FA]